MKTLKAEKGKYLDLRPCLACIPISKMDYHRPLYLNTRVRICPCPNHAGEIQRDNGKMVRFSCENRVMHEAPKIKSKGSKKPVGKQS